MNTIGENAFSAHLDTSKYSPILVCVDKPASDSGSEKSIIPQKMRIKAQNIDYEIWANLMAIYANPDLNRHSFTRLILKDCGSDPQKQIDLLNRVFKLKSQGVIAPNIKLIQEPHKGGYLISRLDPEDKYSENYLNCVGFIGVGQSKKIRQPISLLGHLDTRHLHFHGEKSLKRHLDTSLQSLVARCIPKSIDFVVFGGQLLSDTQQNEYLLQTTEFLSQRVRQILGFDPIATLGPAFTDTLGFPGQSVFFDTSSRRMHSFRKPPTEEAHLFNKTDYLSSLNTFCQKLIEHQNSSSKNILITFFQKLAKLLKKN